MCCAETASSAAYGLSEEADALLVRPRRPAAAGAAAAARRPARRLDDRSTGKLTHLQRRPAGFDCQWPLSELDGRDRARSRFTNGRAYRHPHRNATGNNQQSRRRWLDEGTELLRRG